MVTCSKNASAPNTIISANSTPFKKFIFFNGVRPLLFSADEICPRSERQVPAVSAASPWNQRNSFWISVSSATEYSSFWHTCFCLLSQNVKQGRSNISIRSAPILPFSTNTILPQLSLLLCKFNNNTKSLRIFSTTIVLFLHAVLQ